MNQHGLRTISVLNELLDAASLATACDELPRFDQETRALTDGATGLTWHEYSHRVATLATRLIKTGVGSGDRVGVHVRQAVDAFVSVHAVLRCGAVVVPLDPRAPTVYLRAVIADCQAAVVVSDVPDGQLGGTPVVNPLDSVDDTPSERQPVGPNDPAYIMYTSGSTGRPKGIVHTHASGLAYARLACQTYGVGPSDVAANISPLHFDQSTFALYAAPLAGAAALAVPEPVTKFPASLSRLLEQANASILYTVPYVLEQLSLRGALAERDLDALRWVKYGGESFDPTAIAALMRQLPSARFSNVYGPAEVNQCTFFHLERPEQVDGEVPIGWAWPETELSVVGDDGQPVAPGTPGELLVSTSTMMDRYWRAPELTSQAVATRENEAGETTRWYSTGDLVIERSPQQLVFLGRVDNQVKLRGQRIELEAVDAALRSVAGVDEAVAVIDRTGDEDQLVALVVPIAEEPNKPGEPGETVELLAVAVVEQLRTQLPRYAVPGLVELVHSLPRTSSAKVDRNASLEAFLQSKP